MTTSRINKDQEQRRRQRQCSIAGRDCEKDKDSVIEKKVSRPTESKAAA